jgi:hypothetical protein
LPTQAKRASSPPPPARGLAGSQPAAVSGFIAASREASDPEPSEPRIELPVSEVLYAIEASQGRSDDEATLMSAPSAPSTPGQVISHPGGGAGSERGRKVPNTTGTLRLPVQLPRRRGVLGDIGYAFTAPVRVASSRRELATLERKLVGEQSERERRLIELAREALDDGDLRSATLDRGRDEILEIEEKRSRRAGAVAASDQEIAGLERERAEQREAHLRENHRLRRDIAAAEEQLEPLERRAQAARRRAQKMKDSLDELDRRIAREDGVLGGTPAGDRAEVEANLASMMADRESIADEEPALAGELDELELAIATMSASLGEARARAGKLEKDEAAAIERSAEMITAVRARRTVEGRAEADLACEKEEALLALGERLNVERPPELLLRFAPIELEEVSIATRERRRVELAELVKGVDRSALARGVLWLALAGGLLGAALLVWFRLGG